MMPRDRRQRRDVKAGDHDLPYEFGWLPSVDRPHPFGLFQYARLLLLRGDLQDGAFGDDRRGRYFLSEHQGVVWVERDGNTYFRRPMDPN